MRILYLCFQFVTAFKIIHEKSCIVATESEALHKPSNCKNENSEWSITDAGHLISKSYGLCLDESLKLSKCDSAKKWKCEKNSLKYRNGKFISSSLKLGSEKANFQAYDEKNKLTTGLCHVHAEKEVLNKGFIETASGKRCVFPFYHIRDSSRKFYHCLTTTLENIYHCAINGDIYSHDSRCVMIQNLKNSKGFSVS